MGIISKFKALARDNNAQPELMPSREISVLEDPRFEDAGTNSVDSKYLQPAGP